MISFVLFPQASQPSMNFNISKLPSIHILLFHSYSLGFKATNKFMHSCIPSKTIPEIKPNLAKFMAVLRRKRPQTPTLLGRYIPIW